MLALGEPDGASEHGAQFTYTRKTRDAGVMFVVATIGGSGGVSVERMIYRRLLIGFDEAGLVASARHEVVSCSERELDGARSAPCAEVSGQDVLAADPAGVRLAGGQTQGKAFAPALWSQDIRGFDKIKRFQLEPPGIAGVLVVGDQAILFLSPNADSKSEPMLKLPYTEIADVYVDAFGVSRRLVIKRTNGVYDSFSIAVGHAVYSKLAESAGELAKSRWQSAINK